MAASLEGGFVLHRGKCFAQLNVLHKEFASVENCELDFNLVVKWLESNIICLLNLV